MESSEEKSRREGGEGQRTRMHTLAYKGSLAKAKKCPAYPPNLTTLRYVEKVLGPLKQPVFSQIDIGSAHTAYEIDLFFGRGTPPQLPALDNPIN
eukprot:1156676-Pelagomonas_calceolata.AAC.3